MLDNCKSLTNLPNLSGWNTLKAREMNYMFSNCTKLKSIDGISNWNVMKVISMNNMFENYSSLNSLSDNPDNKPNWKIDKNLDKSFIFKGCDLLKEKGKINFIYK